MMRRVGIIGIASALAFGASARGDDGYRLWLRYDRIADASVAQAYLSATSTLVLALPGDLDSPILVSAKQELDDGLSSLLGHRPEIRIEALAATASGLGEEGYGIARRGENAVVITANRPAGILYGAFALLREIQTRVPLGRLATSSAPRIERRILDHWDNLNRTVERGYAGFSLWEWYVLPAYRTPRYRDYARACASVGINGAVLNNVNADPLILTPPYLEKVAALAAELRPWGMRIYLAARFTAPIDLGELKTADPLNPQVARWWKAKADEIYRTIPDFGGFLVKANSEGQPGPQDSGRTHADGANVIADALAPHGGIVMWRAFVYGAHPEIDRVRQAYLEFKPLDGKFRPNVVLQIKNGPLDFQPREPFHPLFGAMPRTRLALELQITQEYLGASIQLAYLGPLFEEVLRSDTYAAGPGTTIGRIVEGAPGAPGVSVIAGVANTGTDRDWTGHPLAAANWYAFGRLAWNDELDSKAIAEEWTRMTLGNDPRVLEPVVGMLQESREDVVNYSMPLGLHHIMATDYHYGPGPWAKTSRPDWTPSYYHRADAVGLGADRTATGTNALADYAPEIAKLWGDPATCPEKLLLWFHHVPWGKTLKSGRTLWDELCLRYQSGVDGVRRMERTWEGVSGLVDAQRHEHVAALLGEQERDAEAWRDACIQYFQQFSRKPAPAGVEPPLHSLAYYESILLHHFPGTPSDQ
ncbi:MAG TPA: alpha-glucuronidase family glycosyl hydrolase [Opitutaceae bacterium]|jgi:alpha-glucuronidase